MKVELNDRVLEILEKFLNRVELRGAEVPQFLEVVNALRPIQTNDSNDNK